MKVHKVLSKEEQAALARAAQRGDLSARHALVEHNMRVLVKEARAYEKTGRSLGLEVEDLVFEAAIGMENAIDKYDESYGTSFVTFAIRYVRNAIAKAVDNGGLMRISTHSARKVRNYYKFLEYGLSKEDALKASESKPKDLKNCSATVSFFDDLGCHAGVDDPIATFDPPDSHDYSKENVEKVEAKVIFSRCKRLLDEKTFDMVKMKFGLEDTAPYSLSIIADKYGITKERVRQKIEIGLRALRRDEHLKEIAKANALVS